ncbi:MAG: hypothetical protein K6E63_04070 [Lachnospiraceae bacterium]|nr:hypothetical protein [Lachnospiraceae bacterium]
MSKRIMSVVVAVLLVAAMTVNVFAGSNSGSNAASQASQAPAVETTPTGQPITDAYVAALASLTLDGNGAALPAISKNTLIAFSKYFKNLLKLNAAIIAGATEDGKGGKRTLKGPLYAAGMTYTVYAQVTSGATVTVQPVQATCTKAGTINFTLPVGTISYCVAGNAVAP